MQGLSGAEDVDIATTPVTRIDFMRGKQSRQAAGGIDLAVDETVAEPRRIPGAEILVSANAELILDLRKRRAVDGVGGANAVAALQAGTCGREDKLGIGDHARVYQVRRDLIAGKCRACVRATGIAVDGYAGRLKGIEDWELTVVGDVSGKLFSGRHKQKIVCRFRVAVALIGAKEEALVSSVVELRNPHWTAPRRAKLVLMEGRLCNKTGRCVQGLVAEILPEGPVQIVGAALGNDIDNAAQYATEFGAVGVGDDLKFLDGVDDRRHGVRALNRAVVVQTIQQEEVAAIGLSIDRREGIV